MDGNFYAASDRTHLLTLLRGMLGGLFPAHGRLHDRLVGLALRVSKDSGGLRVRQVGARHYATLAANGKTHVARSVDEDTAVTLALLSHFKVELPWAYASDVARFNDPLDVQSSTG